MGRKKSKKEELAFDDYEYGYGYDYLLDEEQKKPTDTADDADGLEEDEGVWWEDEPEENVLARIRESYREDSDEGREYKPDDETIDIPLENLLLDGGRKGRAGGNRGTEALAEGTAGRGPSPF